MVSAPPVATRTALLCALLLGLLGLLNCTSLEPESTEVQVAATPENLQSDLTQLERHLRGGEREAALQVWQRLDLDQRRGDGGTSDLGYLRSRLFSARMLQDHDDDWANSQVSSLAIDYDDLWIGTWLGGVARYSLPLGQFEVFVPNRRSLEPLVVYHVRPTARYVWVLANDGIKRYDKRLGRMINFAPAGFRAKPTDVLELDSDRVLVSTIDEGLWQLAGGSSTRLDSGPAGNHLTVLARSQTFGVLIGTVDRGVFTYQNGRVRPLIASPRERKSANITSIIDDGKDIWVGTSGQGVLRWEQGREKSRRYDASNSLLPDNWVEDLLLYDDRLFAVTMRGGFVSYDYQQKNWVDWRAESGLMSDTVTALVAAGGKLYYGTLGSGVIRLDWADYVNNR